MIPQHVKQLDVTVKNVDEMIMVLKRFNHLYIVIFRFSEHFLGRPQEIVVWLQNKTIDFTYHYMNMNTVICLYGSIKRWLIVSR